MSSVSQQNPAGNDNGSARMSPTDLSGSISSLPSITSSETVARYEQGTLHNVQHRYKRIGKHHSTCEPVWPSGKALGW